MPRLTHRLPRRFWVAVSGGIDSMSFLHFLNKPSRKDSLLGVAYINHATEYGCRAEGFLWSYCKENNIEFRANHLHGSPPKGESKECWWRNQRYEIFSGYKAPIILGHHLDDCLEEYLMCMVIRGFEGTIPYRHSNCIRPFRLWSKNEIKEYATKHSVPYIEDPSNSETRYKRNAIRMELVPRVLELNPGVYNIVRRLIVKQDERDGELDE